MGLFNRNKTSSAFYSNSSNSVKEQFIRSLMSETGFTRALAEETYNINEVFQFSGKQAGLARLDALKQALLSTDSTNSIITYGMICGMMVSMNHITNSESKELAAEYGKAFVNKLQNK